MTPNKIMKKYEVAQSRLKVLTSKYKNAINKERRIKNRCSMLVNELKKLKFLNDELTDKIMNFDGNFIFLLILF